MKMKDKKNRNLKIFNFKKKSQMEILGLAVIIVLLSFGLLLVFKFVLMKDSGTPVKQTFSESQQASNILSSILRTSSGCRNTDMTELLQDCASLVPTLRCQVGGELFYDEFGSGAPTVVDSCEYVRATVSYLLNQTFKTWNKKYYFIASVSGENPDDPRIKIGNKCQGEVNPETMPLPTSGGQTLFVEFAVCR